MNSNKTSELAKKTTENILGPNPVIGLNRSALFNTFKDLSVSVIKRPKQLIGHQLHFLNELKNIALGTSEIDSDPKDMRFADPAWKKNEAYNKLKQAYLAFQHEVNHLIEDLEMSPIAEDRTKFLTQMMTEAISPSNWIINPTALKKAIDTGGKSFRDGAKNLIADVVNNGGYPSQVDTSSFKVGKDLAITPGKVVYRNEVCELIQYAPQSEKVYARPLLIVPPQINKFYALDLSPGKSFAEFLVRNQVQCFAISWRNPTSEQRTWNLKTYIDTIEEVTEIIKIITDVKKINIWGACSGGITLSAALAYLKAKGDFNYSSASFVVSAIDIRGSERTTAGLWADKASIAIAREKSHIQGVLKGKDMATMFSWMRPNDLIWNYWVNNYLLGNKPPKFDILYWNSDTTNLPAALHADFLDIMASNKLAQKNGIKVGEYDIDLSTVDCDMMFVGGLTDHITPWHLCYNSAKLFDTKTSFILGNKGHIQTLLNAPGNKKGAYYLNDGSDMSESPNEWLNNAELNEGSWWPYFVGWVGKRSGKLKTAPKELGNTLHQPLYDAPGQYVFD